ncbi:MAG TPA: hypothetical protein VKA87_09705 [Nitrososphaeraceae archaeon]|nr:hypothetical protein [Nitrososphaeraceae archaeon]
MLGVSLFTVAVTIPLQQQANAAGGGCNPAGRPVGTPAINASKGRCFRP